MSQNTLQSPEKTPEVAKEARKPMLTTEQVSHRMQKHPYTVNKMARDGKIPASKVGRDWRFDPDAFEEYLQPKSKSESESKSTQGRQQ
jgi:excisionase family DNA binding protein